MPTAFVELEPRSTINVTGVLVPDATCNYVYQGIINGKAWYQREDTAYFIRWEIAPNRWYLYQGPVGAPTPLWESPTLIGSDWTTVPPGIGSPTVAVGTH